MAKNKPFLNRLEELFSGTEPVAPAPEKVAQPQLASDLEQAAVSESQQDRLKVMYADIPGMIDRDLAKVLEIGRVMGRAQNLPRLLEDTTRLCAEQYNLDEVQIYLYDAGENCMILGDAWGSSKEPIRREYSLAIDAKTAAGQAFTTLQPVLMPVGPALELALPLLRTVTSVEAGEPGKGLLAPERVFGALVLQNTSPVAFHPNRRLVFEILASRLAAAIELIRQAPDGASEAEGRGQVGWNEFLDAINRKDQVGFCYDNQPGETVSELTGTLPADGSETISDSVLTTQLQVGDETIGTLQLERQPEMEPFLNSGQPEDRAKPATWDSSEVELVKSVADRVAQHLENLRLLAQAERYRTEAEDVARRLTRQGWESYIATPQTPLNGFVYDQDMVKPLEEAPHTRGRSRRKVEDTVTAHHQTTGVIKVRDEQIGEVAVEDTVQDDELATGILAAVSERLGTHIENLRLLEETERGRAQLDKRAAELETVARVSTAAATILSPQELLQSVVDLTKYSFNLYHTQVYLLDDDESTLILTAGAGKIGHRMVSEGDTIDLNLSQSVTARAAVSRAGVLVNDVRLDENFVSYPLLPDALSEMSVPMIVGDQLVGVFDVLANVTDRFSEEDMRTYNTLASQVAVALRNAELYAEQMATVARLRELDHLKSSFLANMSHELRTPLNSILGFAQVIIEGLDGPLTDDMSNDLGLIEKNGKHLLNLINEILDMAKIEAGRLSLTPEPVNLLELMEEVVDSSASLMRDKSLYLRIENPELANLNLMLDYTRMRQVFTNLIGNASKFTEEGGLSIDFIHQANKLSVLFKDTGMGIPPNKLDMIFEQFSQVDTSTTRKAGGTGLGLPISRRLVELHGGRLWADSTGIPGEGSVFTVELPFTPVAKV